MKVSSDLTTKHYNKTVNMHFHSKYVGLLNKLTQLAKAHTHFTSINKLSNGTISKATKCNRNCANGKTALETQLKPHILGTVFGVKQFRYTFFALNFFFFLWFVIL